MAPDPASLTTEQALQADIAARAAALDPKRSFLLQAPAGSGKTTVLSCRLLALLAHVDAPEEILAITFTRKAAAEMRARVLKALRAAQQGEAGRALEAPLAAAALRRDRERDWRLLETPARLRVMTIDAYCQTLAAQLPIASRSALRLEIAAPARPLYAAAARRLLERALEDAELVTPVQLLFGRLDNDWSRFEELLVLMLEQRAHWLPRVLASEGPELGARVVASLAVLVAEQLGQALDALPAAQLRQGAELAARAARNLLAAATGRAEALEAGARDWAAAPAGTPLRADPKDLPRWQFMARLAVTSAGEWRRAWNKTLGVNPAPSPDKAALESWVKALSGFDSARATINGLLLLPDTIISAEDTEALGALSFLLRHAAAELQLEFAVQGRVDFAAIAAAARAALTEAGEPTDLALRCGSAIHHILIDEFQDTSLDQFELLQALTAGWEPHDGRTLFAVGDPMQSIYQFREAEVGLFLRARASGIGAVRLESLQLHRNFRSAPQLIDWVNERCGALFPARDDARLAAIRYLPAVAARTELTGAVAVHALGSPGAEVEAARIVELVRARRSREPGLEIAVLVNARQQAAPIAEALLAAGIPVRGLKLEPLRDASVVRDLCALARALQHPGDRNAWLSVLHAPYCGLSLAELQLLSEGQGATLWELATEPSRRALLPADAQRRLARVCLALQPALWGPERALPLWQRVDRAWLRLGGPAACEEERELLDAREFLRALAAEPRAEELSGDAFDEFAAALYAAPAAAENAVEILTMHGAKGLEWDIVIVPGIGLGQRHDVEPLLHWLELPGTGARPELLLAPIGAAGVAPSRSLAGYIRHLRRARARLERVRLLYVAATRARRELHWLGTAPVNSAGELAPRPGTALALLWPSVSEVFQAAHAAGVAERPQESSDVPVAGRRLSADWEPRDLPPPAPATRLEHSLREDTTEPEYSWVRLASRAVGTIVHAELQRLAQEASLPERLDTVPEDYDGWLEEQGVAAVERAAAGARIHAALSAALRDARGRWLLGGEHRAAHSEWRLTGRHAGRVVNVVIDRLLIEPDGQRWVVDYKTGTHEGGQLAAFLAEEELRYRPQLQRYAALVRAASPGPVRAALYFPLLGEFREVALDGSGK
ncbi:MAG TPA: UvrD-helicase domain-containing protein [Steroidobacteraceae bacterium]|nr:UvrD-helicase domain-containing protein [Steroidobacteraceae bacterium]